MRDNTGIWEWSKTNKISTTDLSERSTLFPTKRIENKETKLCRLLNPFILPLSTAWYSIPRLSTTQNIPLPYNEKSALCLFNAMEVAPDTNTPSGSLDRNITLSGSLSLTFLSLSWDDELCEFVFEDDDEEDEDDDVGGGDDTTTVEEEFIGGGL